jgi:lipopolysaccharide/colanic/teichoic acid biosynthesis glycosyltransferase
MLLKRFLDVVISSLALIVLSPVFLIVAAAVWFELGTPVLFRQCRVGLKFRPFYILKFRTMRFANGPRLTVVGDGRVRRIGRYLRLAKLDELPQLWNVILGDMSLVGPRPELPEYVNIYRDRYDKVLTVRPGITDLASIHFRNEEAMLSQSVEPLREYAERILPAKLDLAEEYVRTRTALGDIFILFRTVTSIVRGTDLIDQ